MYKLSRKFQEQLILAELVIPPKISSPC